MKKTIFVVDDSDTNLTVAKEALKEHYRVMTLPSAEKMFMLLEKVNADLILLDIEMPEMNGFEALQQLKGNASYTDIPVIFLTSITDSDTEARGFQLGVIDFINKPFSTPVLINRVKAHLDIDGLIRERTAKLIQRTEQLLNLKNSLVFVLADMVENRDHGTGGHVERTTVYIEILINNMMSCGMLASEVSEMDLNLLCSSARLHDVGKIAISDTILNKPGKLTDEEFAIMKTHAAEGERIINQVVSRTGNEEFLHNAKLFAGYHHERWDGKGYPYGLFESNIPFQGRVMAFVDVYDALISVRPYKKSFTHEEAMEIIMEGAGKQFDPLIADVFYKSSEQLKEVKNYG